ncbi:hypothetical protein K449DRAFT_426117 [Hypoxylon sp. EC38]|nr:hypothetical protein K449DRAFT_426117 [Hypoxylon sp. EC38]
MYGPAPPRPKKTNIVRARTGCRNCRMRRKKCDERRPACDACIRLGRRCDGYGTNLKFRNVSLATKAHPSPLPEIDNNYGVVSNTSTMPSLASTQTVNSTNHCSVLSRISFDTALKVDMTMKPTKESFYMSIWGNQCAPALHPIFHRLARLENSSPVVLDTMMALAARQLSRMLPRAREFGSLDILGSSFRPDQEQQNISTEFSCSAMRSVARWTLADFGSNWTTALAVLILFCYLESLMSNFQGFYIHSAAVETLMNTQGGHKAKLSGHERDLIAAWVQSKMHNCFQRDHPPLTILPTMLSVTDDSLDAQFTTQGDPSSDSSAFLVAQEERLKSQRDALNNWYAKRLPSELPIDSYSTTYNDIGKEFTDMQIQPLRFKSHDAAMNFAYCVTARVMQCTKFLSVLQSNHRQAGTNQPFCTANPWIMVLLRIAAGIDWESCTRLNAYTIGISSLLLACVLRSDEPAVGTWVQDWLNQRYLEGCLEEGSFPIFQILQVLRIIIEERRFGRHVYVVCQPIDDGGGVVRSSYRFWSTDGAWTPIAFTRVTFS